MKVEEDVPFFIPALRRAFKSDDFPTLGMPTTRTFMSSSVAEFLVAKAAQRDEYKRGSRQQVSRARTRRERGENGDEPFRCRRMFLASSSSWVLAKRTFWLACFLKACLSGWRQVREGERSREPTRERSARPTEDLRRENKRDGPPRNALRPDLVWCRRRVSLSFVRSRARCPTASLPPS